ncbi:hypothetical protein SAMN06272789_7137 [Streptomyces sp. 1331.2]|nr:hypothetical protein SAMN06272789_7137 [Streptomyces sp. 1331.2]
MPFSLEIDRLRRSAREDSRDDPHWHLESHLFELKFRAAGFRQYLRQAPQHSLPLALQHHQRGGFSFAETAFA